METRKLSSDEVLELVENEMERCFRTYGMIVKWRVLEDVKQKVDFVESIPKRSKFTKFIDNHQTSLWFFILLATVVMAMKLGIEGYLFKN